MAHTKQWNQCEMEAAMALVDLSSPPATPSAAAFPILNTKPKQSRTPIVPLPEEDEHLIEGRRAGMTPSQLMEAYDLPSFKDKPLHQIASRLRKLARDGHDVVPRTEEYRKRSAARRELDQTKEMKEIAAACQKGMSLREILDAGIVKHGNKDERSLRLRIYRMKQRGLDPVVSVEVKEQMLKYETLEDSKVRPHSQSCQYTLVNHIIRGKETLYSLAYTDPDAKLKEKYEELTGREYSLDAMCQCLDPDFLILCKIPAFRAEVDLDKQDEYEETESDPTCTVEETITTESTMEEVSDSQETEGGRTIMGEEDSTYQQHEFAGDPGFGKTGLGKAFKYVVRDDRVEEAGWYTSDDEFPDPEPIRDIRQAPGKGEQKKTEDQIAEFQSRWADRPLDHLSPEEQDRYYIKHARRHGMTASAMEKAKVLKTGRVDAVGITYRMQKLKEEGKDIKPRTAQAAWKQYKKKNSVLTPATYETIELMEAMRQGKTIEEIVELEIVTVGRNTRKAIRHRWDTYIRRNTGVPKIKSDRDKNEEHHEMKKQSVRKTQFKKGGAKKAGNKEKKQKDGKRDKEEKQTVESEKVKEDGEDWFDKMWPRVKVL
ncbi:MAG: hypothetical protein Q9208_004228 [Pyrenodesmia sp. 3 TL-2023]